MDADAAHCYISSATYIRFSYKLSPHILSHTVSSPYCQPKSINLIPIWLAAMTLIVLSCPIALTTSIASNRLARRLEMSLSPRHDPARKLKPVRVAAYILSRSRSRSCCQNPCLDDDRRYTMIINGRIHHEQLGRIFQNCSSCPTVVPCDNVLKPSLSSVLVNIYVDRTAAAPKTYRKASR